MAYAIEVFENSRTGQMREAPVGFSWTNLLFGFFVPLSRSDWKWAIIQAFAAIFSVGLSWLVFPFFYNQLYASDLEKNGYARSESGQEGEASAQSTLGRGAILSTSVCHNEDTERETEQPIWVSLLILAGIVAFIAALLGIISYRQSHAETSLDGPSVDLTARLEADRTIPEHSLLKNQVRDELKISSRTR